jgi:4-aminobutyrate aminotransferase-like enzyme
MKSARLLSAKKEMLDALVDATQSLRQLRPSSPELKDQYAQLLQEFTRNRGRDLYFPLLGSGTGSGPFMELVDGSTKFDMITGIGINFFGHAHPAFIAETLEAATSTPWQGNLQPGVEAADLMKLLLSQVGQGSRLKQGWLTTCGTMANENAVKIIRQKKFPATKILAFRDCFAGRSTLMAEITDNPGYRQGQPVYGEVYYLSFYDPKLGLEKSVERTLKEMRDHLTRYPGKFCAIMIELIQGEGGFNAAPREWYVQVFEEAKKQSLAIFADEIQTFGRTGELFAYQKLGLNEYIDVVTVAKMLQASALLFTEEYNPKPGLMAGTFAGSNVGLRTARRTLELLREGGVLGPAGGSCQGKISDIRAIGGMIAFQPHAGTMDDVKKTLMKLFDLGVVAFYCGHGPYLIRMLPPLGVMSESEIDQVCGLIEKSVQS